MKTKSLLCAITVVVWSTSVGYAQRVETDLYDGHPVINCDGMLSSAYTTTAKGNTMKLLCGGSANKKVYKRFAVHSDNSTSSLWMDAFTVCSGISGGSWRLPTQRELMLMWVLHPELKKTNGFTPLSSFYYWSATEYTYQGSNSYYVNFTNGYVHGNTNDNVYMVRCIREL